MKRFLYLILFVLCVSTVNAQTADAIAKKYVEAIGGAANWKAIKSLKQTINLNTQGFDLPGTIISDAKNRTRADVEAMGSKIVQAHDGTTAWWINPFQGATVAVKMPEELAYEFMSQEFLDDLIDWKKRGSTLTLEGEETVENQDCFKLKLVKKGNRESILFISKENYLIVKTQSTTNAQGVAQTVESFPSDYKEENGVLIARKVVAKSGGAVLRTTTIKGVEFNVEVTDDIFAMPDN